MNSAKRKGEVSMLGSSQKIDRENVDPLWNVENQQLQIEAQANSRLREEIAKQSYADSAIQIQIKDKIGNLKDRAVTLAQTLESQKRKNVQISLKQLELEAIIRHLVQKQAQERSIQAAHRDDINFENIDNLMRKIKKFEYDLEQMFVKLNDLNSKNKEKKSQVDTYRTQRVIDSGIFLKIQKEIVQSQNDYRKLLIDKSRFQEQYSKNLQNYKKIKNDIEKQQSVSLNRKQSQEKQEPSDQFFINAPEIQHAVKFTQIQNNKRKSSISSKKFLSVIEAKKEQHFQEVEHAVKRVFVETGLTSAESLIHLLYNIQNVNEELYKKVNEDTDKICNLKLQICQLRKKKEQKTVKYYEKEPQPTKAEVKIKEAKTIEEQIEKLDQIHVQISSSLENLLNSPMIQTISQLAGVNLDNKKGIDDLNEFFTNLQVKLEPLIANYSQFKKDIEESPLKNRDTDQKDETNLEQLIMKVKRMEQSEKIMVKEDFKKEYEKLLKSEGGKYRNAKKKPSVVIKKH